MGRPPPPYVQRPPPAASTLNDSFRIATVFGIPIRVHWTFLILFVLFAQISGSAAWILLLFFCVLLHELGHSLVARRFGIRVIDITFWPLGGMARMTEFPEDAEIEGWVAFAGPAVNFILATIGSFFLLATGLQGESGQASAAAIFVTINLLLGTFNLLPAFPMDGGRLLRAWFARKGDWVQATERAVRVGRWVAAGMFGYSLLSMVSPLPGFSCALPLIAVFVWFAGGRELMAVRIKHGLSPFGGLRAFSFGNQGGGAFGRRSPSGGAAWAEAEFEEAPPQAGGKAHSWNSPQPKSGFDEETIRQLERYRGRLKRFDGDEDF